MIIDTAGNHGQSPVVRSSFLSTSYIVHANCGLESAERTRMTDGLRLAADSLRR